MGSHHASAKEVTHTPHIHQNTYIPNTETTTTTQQHNIMYNIFKYLLLVLLCLMIGGDGEELAAAASNTKTKTKIPPILPDDPLDLPPLFQDDFESIVEVKNLETKETYMIHEKVKRDSVWLQMNKSNDKKLRTCT